MSKPLIKKILQDSQYCAQEIGKDCITPNILLHVITLNSAVRSELERNGTDMKLLGYLLNPYHVRDGKSKKVSLNPEAKKLIASIDSGDGYLEIFEKMMKERYVNRVIEMSGYTRKEDGIKLINKYTQKITGGKVKNEDREKFKKLRSQLGTKNVMVMGAIGSGRDAFIADFAKYYEKDFSIYSFDLFRFLKIDANRLFGIISGVFEDLEDDYIYIPNLIQTLVWIKSLKLEDIYTLLEELAQRGKIITKINKNNFDSKQFNLSKNFNFYSVGVPVITLHELFDVLNEQALIYEKFYGITIKKELLKHLIKEGNFSDVSLSQPGRSLKRLMHSAFVNYGDDPSIQEKPKGKENLLQGLQLDTLLNEKIIGQQKAIGELTYEIGKVDFLEGGIVRTFLLQGEIGCGKLKTANELSRILFGQDSLRYLDMSIYQEFPFKMRIYEALDHAINSLYGGVLYLDNIECLNTQEVDIFSYINMKAKEVNDDGIIAPIIIIASTRTPITQIQNYRYIIEHFEKVIYFNKLTIRDLEMIARIQIDKVKDILPNNDALNTFTLSIQADSSLNALGVKKLISSMST